MKKEIQNILEEEEVLLVTFGKNRKDSLNAYAKYRIKPIILNDKNIYQMESIKENQAFHKNVDNNKLIDEIIMLLEKDFKMANIYTKSNDYYINISKKEKFSIMKRKATKADMSINDHNKIKNYIISEEDKPDFLIDLGIMTKDYKVKPNSYSKFRQINRFLEILNDDIDNLKKDNINIVDFCCGKGYLTFGVWHYFNKIKKMNTNIIGIDLKEKVINYLNSLEYKNIKFMAQDINEYEFSDMDIAILLHACDTATDISLMNAVKNKAKIIMAVPCCQHELFNQMKNDTLEPMLKYGILKDKMTELLTNSLRGLALEACGYEVKMIEFTSLEHTMKNVMIKAVYRGEKSEKAYSEYFELEKEFNVKCKIREMLLEKRSKNDKNSSCK